MTRIVPYLVYIYIQTAHTCARHDCVYNTLGGEISCTRERASLYQKLHRVGRRGNCAPGVNSYLYIYTYTPMYIFTARARALYIRAITSSAVFCFSCTAAAAAARLTFRRSCCSRNSELCFYVDVFTGVSEFIFGSRGGEVRCVYVCVCILYLLEAFFSSLFVCLK